MDGCVIEDDMHGRAQFGKVTCKNNSPQHYLFQSLSIVLYIHFPVLSIPLPFISRMGSSLADLAMPRPLACLNSHFRVSF